MSDTAFLALRMRSSKGREATGIIPLDEGAASGSVSALTAAAQDCLDMADVETFQVLTEYEDDETVGAVGELATPAYALVVTRAWPDGTIREAVLPGPKRELFDAELQPLEPMPADIVDFVSGWFLIAPWVEMGGGLELQATYRLVSNIETGPQALRSAAEYLARAAMAGEWYSQHGLDVKGISDEA